jgi:hypothetical protein
MATVRRESFQSNEEVVRQGYALLRDALLHDPAILRLVDALERSHLLTLALLETTSELYLTVDLNLRSLLERTGV